MRFLSWAAKAFLVPLTLSVNASAGTIESNDCILTLKVGGIFHYPSRLWSNEDATHYRMRLQQTLRAEAVHALIARKKGYRLLEGASAEGGLFLNLDFEARASDPDFIEDATCDVTTTMVDGSGEIISLGEEHRSMTYEITPDSISPGHLCLKALKKALAGVPRCVATH
jgi:hypothetical protein